MGKTVSVIVLIYKVEKYLRTCVESILNQTYKDIEVILVDDGSPDRCPEICDEYSRVDPRVKVIHKVNGGIDSARKAGIQAATGDYVGNVDGDDWIEPTMYETLVEILEREDVSVVESGVYDSVGDIHKKRVPFISEGKYKGERFAEEIAPRLLYAGEFFRHGLFPYLVSKLWRRESFAEFQMEPDYSNNIVDDTFVTYPAVMASESLYVTHECFYHYRVRMDSAVREMRPDIYEKVKSGYPDWMDKFRKSDPKNIKNMEWQIDNFTAYLLLEKAMQVFDEEGSKTILRPYGGIDRASKIVLYGAGAVGFQLFGYLRKLGITPVCWADRSYKGFPKELGIASPESLLEIDYDYVVISIMTADMVKSAIEGLCDLGVSSEKILWIKDEYLENPKALLEMAGIGL